MKINLPTAIVMAFATFAATVFPALYVHDAPSFGRFVCAVIIDAYLLYCSMLFVQMVIEQLTEKRN